MTVPRPRVVDRNDAPIRGERDYVLHWMTAVRRVDSNFALERAVEHARELRKPLLVFEALRAAYRWASDRLHAFVIDGMRDNATRLAGTGVGYYCYLEPRHGDAKGLLDALARHACVVTTDDAPVFFLPTMVSAAAAKLDVRLEAIDGNGLLPVRATTRVFERAQDFRRHLQRSAAAQIAEAPNANPLEGARLPRFSKLPREITARWPNGLPSDLSGFAIDHAVAPVACEGGAVAGAARLAHFVSKKLSSYGEGRNHPDDEAASGLSPYLHWGYVGVHQILEALADRERWSPAKLKKPNGKRTGFWNMSESAESFLDELLTWRELAYNGAAHREGNEDYATLPVWAKTTLAKHAGDRRDPLYNLQTLESAQTNDDVWNAAQNQLLREGRMHNYLRMLWGKKVLEWSATPQEALDVLLHLNNKYALDGRDPSSTAGIFWIFGRYDRPWGPERPIFGMVRYMTSRSTQRKLRMAHYLAKYR